MKLRYKITLTVSVISILSIIFMLALYSIFLFKEKQIDVKNRLLQDSKDLAFNIESNLLGSLNIIKTLQSAYIVKDFLLESDREYEILNDEQRSLKISSLNARWMSAKDKNDPFVQKYINNKLSLYLREQKEIFSGFYGEIFITNKYGATIATTGKLTTLAHAQKYWWKESYGGGQGKVFFDDRGFDDSVKGYVIGIVVPIRRNGKIIGILKANINVQAQVKKATNIFDVRNNEISKIVRSKGLVVYEEGASPLSTRVSPTIVKMLKKRTALIDIISIDRSEQIVSVAPVQISLNHENIIFGGKKSSIDHILGNDGEIWNVVISKDRNSIFYEVFKDIKTMIYLGILFVFLLSLLIFFIIDKTSAPINKLAIAAKEISRGNRDIIIEPQSDDEIGELAISFRDMLKNLKKTTASRDELREEISKRIEIQKELARKDEILLAQSKQAAMGEMISMIAHQWRQPISVIAMSINNVLASMELEILEDKDIKECGQEILDEVQFLSQTIDDFRNFFKPDKEKKIVKISDIFESLEKMVGKSFENNNITLKLEGDTEVELNTYSSEFLQVLLNIANNAKDAFEDSDIDAKELHVIASKADDSVIIKCCDNAGGIDEKIMDRIFEPYFSTKEEKNGTGIGLYMSKTIVQKHLLGKIWVENSDKGACFMVKLPIRDEEKK